MTNQEFVQRLREVAGFYESHPDLKAPSSLRIDVWLSTKAQIVDTARKLGEAQKIHQENYFYLRKRFGDYVHLDFNVERSEVCRRIVTGTRVKPATPETVVEIVEWRCEEPLLAATGEDNE
jgi:hypothetical protein